MKKGQRIAKEAAIKRAIDKVSAAYGGDDEGWLDEFKQAVLEKYADNLKAAFECFKSLLPVGQYVSSQSCDTDQISSLYNDCCGLRKPFCKCGISNG